MKYCEFVFDNQTIRGFLAQNTGDDLIILVHGFMGNKADHHFMMRSYANAMFSKGFSTYRFDFLGSGDSDGNFLACECISYQIQQLQFIVDAFKKQGYTVHVFAFSLGGVIATHCKGYSSLFLLSPAGNFKEILKEFVRQGTRLENGYDFNGFYISDKLIQETNSFSFFTNIQPVRLTKIVQGSKDQYVSLDSFQTYTNLLQADACLIEGADHCFSAIMYTQEVVKEIGDFYDKVSKEKSTSSYV